MWIASRKISQQARNKIFHQQQAVIRQMATELRERERCDEAFWEGAAFGLLTILYGQAFGPPRTILVFTGAMAFLVFLLFKELIIYQSGRAYVRRK